MHFLTIAMPFWLTLLNTKDDNLTNNFHFEKKNVKKVLKNIFLWQKFQKWYYICTENKMKTFRNRFPGSIYLRIELIVLL